MLQILLMFIKWSNLPKSVSQKIRQYAGNNVWQQCKLRQKSFMKLTPGIDLTKLFLHRFTYSFVKLDLFIAM
jgi:hypothetical protein